MKLDRRTLLGASAVLGASGIGLASYQARARELARVGHHGDGAGG